MAEDYCSWVAVRSVAAGGAMRSEGVEALCSSLALFLVLPSIDFAATFLEKYSCMKSGSIQ